MTTGPLRPRRLARRALGALVAVAALAAPAAATAATTAIEGSPLKVTVADAGQVQVAPRGGQGQFFPSSSDVGNAGFNLGTDIGGNNPELWGYLGNALTPVSQSPVGGAGTEASPFEQTTVFRAGPIAADQSTFTITQTVFYVNGHGHFRVRYAVVHDGGSTIAVRPFASADLVVDGDDSGVGVFEPGPPRFVGGAHPTSGARVGLLELTPWAHYEEDGYTTVNSNIRDLSGPGLDDSVNSQNVDNGTGVQWADTPLCPGCGATYETAWRVSGVRSLALDPTHADLLLGELHRLRATTAVVGQPGQAGQTLHWTVSGANEASGTATTGGDGSAEILLRGRNAGDDVISVHWDADRDGTHSAGELIETATVRWLPAPEVGRTVNARPTQGEVYFRPPPGSALARRAARARPSQSGAPRGFLPLPSAGALPVRSILDTSRGKVLVQSARTSRGGVQTAEFNGGRFQIVQRRARRPVTEMVMKGGTYRGCPRTGARRADAESSRHRRSRNSRVRRLWGRGRGRYRTRGRYSSATVRGTTWLVEDRCGGTLTRLPRRPRGSRVVVRDFQRRATITLRSGQRYFARARR